MLQLIDSADVLIENFRPSTLERLGLAPRSCSSATLDWSC